MGTPSEGSPPDLSGQLTGLLDCRMSPAQFWSWFLRAQSGIELYGSDDDNDLASLIENIFAEYTGGHITTDDLLAGLAREVEGEHPWVLGQRQGVA